MKVYQFLKWLKAEAIITIEPKSRIGYFVRKMKKNEFYEVYQPIKIKQVEQFEIINIQFYDNDDYGIIIAVKEEEFEGA